MVNTSATTSALQGFIVINTKKLEKHSGAHAGTDKKNKNWTGLHSDGNIAKQATYF